MRWHCPDDEPTQPIAVLTPADLECLQWMQHAKRIKEERAQREKGQTNVGR
jgi:hypothetical protein